MARSILVLILAAAPALTQYNANTYNVRPSGGSVGQVCFYETAANGSNKVCLSAAAALSGDATFKLPTADGSSGQALTTDGSGQLGFTTVSSPPFASATTMMNGGGGTYHQYRVVGDSGSIGFEIERARGTIISPTDVSSGDVLWQMWTYGYKDGAWEDAAAYRMEVDTTSSSLVRGRHSWRMTNASGIMTEYMGLTPTTLTFPQNETISLGTQAAHPDTVFGRRWESYDGTYARIVLNNPGAASNTGSAISVLNASGSSMLSLSYAGSLTSVNITATGNLYAYGVLELEDDDASNYVRIQAPSAVSSNYTITMRASDCAAGEYLTLGSSGTMTCSAPSGAGLPVVDTTSIVEGSSDNTKELRIEVDGFTTATTRVWTAPNANITVAGIDLAQTWTATQNFAKIAATSTTWSARMNTWLDVTSSACGLGWVGNNIYLNQSDNVAKAANTHANLGGSGIQFNTCGSGQSIAFYILASGTATTADNTVTPTKMWEVNNSGDWMPSSTSRNIGSTATAVGIGYFQQAKYNDGTYDRAGFKCCTGNAFWYADASNVNKFYVSTAGSLYAANSVTTDGGVTFGGSSALTQGATSRIDSSGNVNAASLLIGGTSRINSSSQWVGTNWLSSSNGTYDVGSQSNRWANYYASTAYYIWDGTYTRFSASGGSVIGRNSSGTTQWTINTTSGTMEVLNWYIVNGTAGQTATKTVRDSAGTGTCTLVFTGGIYTGGTC